MCTLRSKLVTQWWITSGECFTVNLWNNPKKVRKLFSAYSVQWAVCTVQRVISKSMERVWNVHLGNPLGPPPTHHNFYLVLSTWCTASLSTLPSSTFRALQSLHKLKLVILAELFILGKIYFFGCKNIRIHCKSSLKFIALSGAIAVS